MRALAGRTFTAADDMAGGGPEGPVAVISHGLWQSRFGGATDAIGRSLLVEGVPVTIVGVAPPGLSGVARRPAPETLTHMVPVTPGWFEAYGLPMREGRPLEERDAPGAQAVMVVNEEFVQRFFPGRGLVGQTLRMTFAFPDGEFLLGLAAGGVDAVRHRAP